MTFTSNPYNDSAITGKPAANEVILNMNCEVFQSNSEGKKE
jgi:hypothetical protein